MTTFIRQDWQTTQVKTADRREKIEEDLTKIKKRIKQ